MKKLVILLLMALTVCTLSLGVYADPSSGPGDEHDMIITNTQQS